MNSKDNKDKEIVKILLNYIKLSSNSKNINHGFNIGLGFGFNNSQRVITNIFEIIDKNENKLENNNEKRILLFHGTKTQNMLGILSKGLLIAPIESQSSGSRFGNAYLILHSFR